MDTLLLVLGLAGGCAILASIWVSSANSRNHSTKTTIADDKTTESFRESHVSRNGADRRSGVVVKFPLQINDVFVHEDRRSGLDRRFAVA